MEVAQIYIKEQNDTRLFDENDALYKGTIFEILNKPFIIENRKKDFKDKKKNMLAAIQELDFAIIDANLYLLTHNNDEKMLDNMQKWIAEKRKITTIFENQYGPLSINSQFNGKNPYNYGLTDWPWE